jgi:hypothetical protein
MNNIQLIEAKSEKCSVYLSAKIDKDGDLVLEGQDLGSGVEAYWGDSDYEYWVVVSADKKLTLFLLLSQYAFKNINELIKWLDTLEIKYRKLGPVTDAPLITAEVESKQVIFNVNLGGLGIKKVEPMLSIDRKFEDKLILNLLQYMFKSKLFKNDAQFMEWMKGQGIEYKFDSYV